MILIVGDLHFKEELSYADYFKDRREAERQAVLNAIIDAAADCDKVILMGDCFNVKTNPFSVVRDFTNFVERFGDKELFIIAGNHEKTADGRTALDYLKEIKNKNWHIITNQVEQHGELLLCPYFFNPELETNDPAEASELLIKKILHTAFDDPAILPKFLFVHHALSDTKTVSGQMTNTFREIVLPKAQLEQHFLRTFGSHIHQPDRYGKTIVTGCVFANEVGDGYKYVWKLDETTDEVTPVQLPGRRIFKFQDLSGAELLEQLDEIGKNTIVKYVVTDRKINMNGILPVLREFDAYIIVEEYAAERKTIVSVPENTDLNIENLITIYAEQKKLDKTKIFDAWNEIKSL